MPRGFARAIVATALFAHTCVTVFVDLLRLDCDETSMDTFPSGGRARRKSALATSASTSRIDVDLGMRFPASLGRQPSTLLREGLVKQKYVRDIWSWATFYGENLAQILSKTRLNPFEILCNATRILQELSSNSDRSSFEFRSSLVCASLKLQSHPAWIAHGP